jgi:hypothetical protein
MGDECRKNGRVKKFIKTLLGKPKAKRSLGRSRRRWEVNVERILKKQSLGMWTGFIWLTWSSG